jgi:DNA-binding NarL/FixJ family response regulator
MTDPDLRDDIVAAISRELLGGVAEIPDPVERALDVGLRLNALPPLAAELRRIRQGAVLEMRAAGMTYGQIGASLGLHRNRVQQIADGRPGGGKGSRRLEPTTHPEVAE